jgi:Na+/H+ antiporter NhaB
MSGLFRKNMRKVDRFLRAVIAVLLIGVAGSGRVGNLAAIGIATVAIILLVTSLSGACPLYTVIGRGGRPSHG